MSLWILDTDHFSLFQRGHPNVIRRVNSVDAENLALTIISAEEQIRGRLNIIRRSSCEELVLAYSRLQDLLNDLKNINLLSFTDDANKYYKNFIEQKIRIGTRDLRIAAIALSVNGIVVTRNQRDFEKVPGLRWEDWTLEAQDY